jgi:hypothetical protein
VSEVTYRNRLSSSGEKEKKKKKKEDEEEEEEAAIRMKMKEKASSFPLVMQSVVFAEGDLFPRFKRVRNSKSSISSHLGRRTFCTMRALPYQTLSVRSFLALPS